MSMHASHRAAWGAARTEHDETGAQGEGDARKGKTAKFKKRRKEKEKSNEWHRHHLISSQVQWPAETRAARYVPPPRGPLSHACSRLPSLPLARILTPVVVPSPPTSW